MIFLNLIEKGEFKIKTFLEKTLEKITPQANKVLKEILSVSTDGIVVSDVNQNIIIANEAFCSLIKKKMEEIIGTKLFVLLKQFKNDALKDWLELEKTAYIIGSKKDVEFQVIMDGDIKYINVSASFLAGISDKAEGLIISIWQDVTDQKMNKFRLKEIEEKYNSLIKGLSLTRIGIDLINKDYIILFQNQVLKERFGDLTGKICYQKYLALNEPCDNCPMKKAIENNNIEYIELKGVDGRDYQIISAPFPNSDGTIDKVIEIVIDITERKRIERELKESKERYKLIMDNANDLITIINEEYKYEFVNEKILLKLLGYTRNEFLGKIITDFIHQNDLNTAFEAIKNLNDQGTCRIDVRFLKKNGKSIWFEIHGSTFYSEKGEFKILLILRDITYRREAELKIKESEKQYRDIIENINEGYFEVDLKGNFTFVNNAFLNLFGYSREDIINRNYTLFLNEKTIEIVKKMFSEVYRNGNRKSRFQFEQTKRNGKRIVIETSINLKYDKKGNKIGFFGLVRDISELKKVKSLKEKFYDELEKEVQIRTMELNDALEKQKLYLDQIVKASQFKTEFLATMSHELRTPLNAIIGFADLLLEGAYGELNEEQLEFVRDIQESAHYQFDMITNILDITKIESGQFELNLQEFSLNNIVEQVRATFKPLCAKKGLKFKVIGLEEPKKIYADPIRLKEIIFNLIDNAIKYTIEGKITLIIQEKFDHWLFKVRDTGIGIARKDYDIIFKEFKRVDSPYVNSVQGTGLGLSLTKRLVNLHRGEISFKSVLGLGTTFTFTISKKLSKNNKKT
ncbi:MAG: PAS domain S-box protein [Promethearchaeota archaeon]